MSAAESLVGLLLKLRQVAGAVKDGTWGRFWAGLEATIPLFTKRAGQYVDVLIESRRADVRQKDAAVARTHAKTLALLTDLPDRNQQALARRPATDAARAELEAHLLSEIRSAIDGLKSAGVTQLVVEELGPVDALPEVSSAAGSPAVRAVEAALNHRLAPHLVVALEESDTALMVRILGRRIEEGSEPMIGAFTVDTSLGLDAVVSLERATDALYAAIQQYYEEGEVPSDEIRASLQGEIGKTWDGEPSDP